MCTLKMYLFLPGYTHNIPIIAVLHAALVLLIHTAPGFVFLGLAAMVIITITGCWSVVPLIGWFVGCRQKHRSGIFAMFVGGVMMPFSVQFKIME